MNLFIRSWSVAAVVAIMAGCSSSAPSAAPRENLSYLYGRDAALLRLSARIYHASPVRSQIYFKLHTRDLLYKGDGSGGPFGADVKVTYEAFDAATGKQLLDSSSTRVRDRSTNPGDDKELIGSMELDRNGSHAFRVKVTAHDLQRDLISSVIISVPATQPGDRLTFLPVDGRTGLPLFDDHLSAPGLVKVRCEQYPVTMLHVERYDQTFKLPTPVFTEQQVPPIDLSPDSLFTVTTSEQGTFELELKGQGFYHIRPDSATQQGLTLFVMKDCYPGVRTSADMMPPLRYITSMQEWERISAATDKRRAVEKFWLDAAGDRERARDAIRAFYNRVESANRNFTAHVEGWRTDRGLVHIIFGPPSTVRRNPQSETWVYGEENNMMSLTFNFHKRGGVFTDNDYQLDRDPVFKGAWYRNVESWRNGRIYQN
jgi:GWxTD domain-containing protein